MPEISLSNQLATLSAVHLRSNVHKSTSAAHNHPPSTIHTLASGRHGGMRLRLDIKTARLRHGGMHLRLDIKTARLSSSWLIMITSQLGSD